MRARSSLSLTAAAAGVCLSGQKIFQLRLHSQLQFYFHLPFHVVCLNVFFFFFFVAPYHALRLTMYRFVFVTVAFACVQLLLLLLSLCSIHCLWHKFDFYKLLRRCYSTRSPIWVLRRSSASSVYGCCWHCCHCCSCCCINFSCNCFSVSCSVAGHCRWWAIAA